MTTAIKGSGTIAAMNQAKITAQAVRKVDQVNFGVNEDVKEGDVIATLSEATDTEKEDLKAAQEALKTLQNQKLTDDLQAPVYDYTSQQRAISDSLEALNKAVLALTTSSSTELKTAQIRATIVVERAGQKGILIGAKGERLKEIGSAARLEMEERFGYPIFLELWVKVKPGWRKSPDELRRLGYAF